MPLRRRIIFSLLWLYKRTLSPLFQMMGPTCRHAPTCSEYAAEAIARHGWWAGSWMALARVSRCRPGGSRGYDPAPENKPAAPFFAPWRYGDWDTRDRGTGESSVEGSGQKPVCGCCTPDEQI